MVQRGVAAAALTLLTLLASRVACEKKPHIVFILADDFGWGNLGVHATASASSPPSEQQHAREAHTPFLDELISQGVLLDRHYAYRICGPSRSSLQSGRLAVHVNTQNSAPQLYNPGDPVSGYAGIPRNMTGNGGKTSRFWI